MSNSEIDDALMAAVEFYARPLPDAGERAAFVREVCAELARVPQLGPGIIARIARDAQVRYLDQYAVGSGTAKYARDARLRPSK